MWWPGISDTVVPTKNWTNSRIELMDQVVDLVYENHNLFTHLPVSTSGLFRRPLKHFLSLAFWKTMYSPPDYTTSVHNHLTKQQFMGHPT